MIKIKVPATTANIGPGFDTLGMALGMYNTFYFYESDKEKDFDDDNLIYKSAKIVYDKANADSSRLRFTVESDIPMTRGLGSSSTCVVAGILGANELLNRHLTEEEILELAFEIEGHPDNVVPALVGGCVFATRNGDKIVYHKIDGLEKVRVIAAIPDFPLETSLARSVLPEIVPYEDAISNMRNLSLLLEGLRASDLDLIIAGAKDKLHEPYRYSLIEGYDKMREIEDYFKGKVVISGAGSTLLFITDDKVDSEIISKKWKELSLELGHSWLIKPLEINHDGAKIL